MLLYDYQYALVSCLATITMLVMHYQRRGYSTRTTRVFTSLLYSNLLTTLADIVTFFTISFPQNYSLSFCYFSNIFYLMCFALVGGNFARYLAALDGRIQVKKYMDYAVSVVLAVVFLLLVTTERTHWVIYFDEGLHYSHGPLMSVLTILPLVIIGAMILLLLRQKDRFNTLQRRTVVLCFFLVLVCRTLQFVVPRMDIGNTLCALLLFVINAVFENPGYYTFNTHGCMNAKALRGQLEQYPEERRNNITLVLVGIANRPDSRTVAEMDRYETLMNRISGRIQDAFRRSVYCVENGKYVLIQHSQNEEKLESMAKRLDALFEKPIMLGKKPVRVQIYKRFVPLQSIQVSEDFIDHFIQTMQTYPIEVLFGTADFFRLPLHLHRTEQMEDLMLRAIREDGIVVHYQPIYSPESGTYCAAEALLRLKESGYERVNIEQLIAAAEKNFSIVKAGEIVLRKVCEFICSEEFKQSGLETIGINVSAVQLKQKGGAENVLAVMREYGVEPSRISMEITESAVLLNDPVIRENLRQALEAGLHFSVDDYGSGFASPDYLYRLPVDCVKLDRSMLLAAMESEEGRIVFQNTIRMIRDLKKLVLVEGAETGEMLELIRETGCDYIQGYYYSRPLDREALIRFLERSRQPDN